MNQFFHRTYTHPVDGTTLDMKMLCNWYWYDETAILETGKGTKDWNFYRYAETLLSAAEAIAQSSGVNAEAAGIFGDKLRHVLTWKVRMFLQSLPSFKD